MPVLDTHDSSDQPWNYLVVVDAGSGGTRALLYRYAPTKPRELHQLHKFQIKPSITHMVLNYWNDSENINGYLQSLLYDMNHLIPKEQHYRTPVLFLASDYDIKNLKPQLQNQVLADVCSFLMNKSGFFVPHCKGFVEVLDDDIESMYSWLSINYLSKGLFNKHEESVNYMGILGSDFQIGIEILDPKARNDDLVNIVLDGDDKYTLSVKSFARYGFNNFHDYYLKSLIGDDDGKEIINDPCLPLDYERDVTLKSLQKIRLHGSGDSAKCTEYINDQLHLNIDKESSLLKSFISTNGFWDTISQLLATDEPIIYQKESLNDLSNNICRLRLDELESFYPNVSKKDLINLCFKSRYIISLIDQVADEDHAMIIQDLFLNPNDNKQDIDFSWTIGRALMYSLDESSGDEDKIGYWKSLSPGLFKSGCPAKRPAYQLLENYKEYTFYKTSYKEQENQLDSWWSYGKGNITCDDGSVYNDMIDGEDFKPGNISIGTKIALIIMSVFIILALSVICKKKLLKICNIVGYYLRQGGKQRHSSNRYRRLDEESQQPVDEYEITDLSPIGNQHQQNQGSNNSKQHSYEGMADDDEFNMSDDLFDNASRTDIVPDFEDDGDDSDGIERVN